MVETLTVKSIKKSNLTACSGYVAKLSANTEAGAGPSTSLISYTRVHCVHSFQFYSYKPAYKVEFLEIESLENSTLTYATIVH